MGARTIEIAVPVHNDYRPIRRAVSSVLCSSSERLLVTVVCHNIETSRISPQLGTLIRDERLQIRQLMDTDRTPASPRNYAITESKADYIAFLDSDDEFEEGALDQWLNELQGSPDLLIGQLRSERTGRIHAPAPRPGRFKGLDPVRDFLNYRTAPLGVLIKRSLLVSESCPMYRRGARTGEDIALGLYLWNYASDIRYSRGRSGYLVNEDGADRVTGEILPAEEQFAAVREALMLPVFSSLSLRRRQAIAIKLTRIQVFGYLTGRLNAGDCDRELLATAAAVLTELSQFAKGFLGFLDNNEIRMVRAIETQNPVNFAGTAQRAEAASSYSTLIPHNPFRLLEPETPLIRERRSNYITAQFGA